MRTLFVAILMAIHLQAQAQVPKRDACAPPPGSVPPALPAKLLPGQGTIGFPITTKNAGAQAFFNQGVAQMHSFWAREAERSFLQAAKLDPEAPMPHWGIAMVAAGDFRPGFQLDLVNGAKAKPRKRAGPAKGGEARAVSAAKKAAELAEAAGRATEREKAYIATMTARRDPDARDGNAAYVKALRKLIATYPKEVEARTYLALQIMSGYVLPEKKPRAGTMEAVGILETLLKEAPDHPGVHHYVIHGWEGSKFAKDAWASCKRYGELASNIPHGLHMPGHIYAQTGRWADAAKSFSDAAANEVYWMKQDSLGGNGHHGHNVHFLAASYSFAGEFEKAMAAGRSLLEYPETPREKAMADNPRGAWRQGWFSILRTLVQHEKWDLILDATTLPEAGKPREEAWRQWAFALAHLNTGARGQAEEAAAKMDRAMIEYTSKAKQPAPAPLAIARAELKAHLERSADKRVRLLEQAARREMALRYNEPPQYPRPVNEALGAFALSQGKNEVAARAYRAALEQYPDSVHAKRGLRAAAERSGKALEAGAGGQ
jgi:tetratricopeptide (TPR) repeat protein